MPVETFITNGKIASVESLHDTKINEWIKEIRANVNAFEINEMTLAALTVDKEIILITQLLYKHA